MLPSCGTGKKEVEREIFISADSPNHSRSKALPFLHLNDSALAGIDQTERLSHVRLVNLHSRNFVKHSPDAKASGFLPILVICHALAVSETALAQRFAVTEIPSTGAAYSVATSINNLGQIAGWYYPAGTSDQRAFFYSGGMLTDLGILQSGDTSRADALNDNGQVVGTSGYSAFLHNAGSMIDLSPPAGTPSNGNGINNAGVVVGQMTDQANNERAFRYHSGSLTDLGTLAGGSNAGARAINESGSIVGFSQTSGNQSHAFLHDGVTMQDLGTLGGTFSIAYALNDNDEVVGYSTTADGSTHAFLHKNGVMLDLDSGGAGSMSMARSINNSGQVVGFLSRPGAANNFLYEGGELIDLNTLIAQGSGWILDEALDINDAGQIVGIGTYNGQTRGYLLTPIPEPATGALLCLGALGVLAFRTRTRN